MENIAQKDGPDIARVASLIGDPARANMLSALMSGKALTATELAAEAGIGASTASSHLGRLSDGGLVTALKQGRHRYYALATPEVAGVLEALMGLAAEVGHHRTRTGPRDPEMRHARVCYDHLAGERGVALYDALQATGRIVVEGEDVSLTDTGRAFFGEMGIDLAAMTRKRRPVCRACLDWSQRRMHLGGALGAGILHILIARKWAVRVPDTRVIRFTGTGTAAFAETFGIGG